MGTSTIGLSTVEALQFILECLKELASFIIFCKVLVLQKLCFGSTKIECLSFCVLLQTC